MARYNSILETIGRTPAVRLRRLGPPGVEIHLKLESFNPMGSVKDRMARAVIEEAERTGALQPGQTVVEATSGNTGIGLAMVCASKGYPLVVTMAENFSVERRRLMRFLGAKVILTPAAQKGSGMLAKAVELAEKHGWFLCRQFENQANARAHYETTAQEILEDFSDRPLDYFVSGFGTGGTLAGVAARLKQESPRTIIVACEPDNSPVLASGIAQPRDETGAAAASHPAFRPHLMQGWSPDFVSPLVESAHGAGLIDRIVGVAGSEALRLARELARREGVLVGISAGATLAAAITIARDAQPGSRILCMLPDTGERYLSTPLFDGIDVDMDDEELALSRSTPGCRFDAPAPSRTPEHTPRIAVQVDDPGFGDASTALFEQIVGDRSQPVVMFALEWCEFCWSVRKFFNRLGIPFRSVDLDSVEYQREDRGARVRAILHERTGSPTIPQIFVAGEHVGGCTEVFDACRDGRLARLLAPHGIHLNTPAGFDPVELLPRWLHPRRTA